MRSVLHLKFAGWYERGNLSERKLERLAKEAAAVENHMIEVAGCTSSTGTELNQKFRDEQAGTGSHRLSAKL